MTEKWRAEKCLPRFVADAAPQASDDTKLYFSVIHFSVGAFVQANLTLSI
jgi:hypothetical protein